jgi:hypothetical protein
VKPSKNKMPHSKNIKKTPTKKKFEKKKNYPNKKISITEKK